MKNVFLPLQDGSLLHTLLPSQIIVPLAADAVYPVLQLSVKPSPVCPPDVGLTEVESVIVWLPEQVLTEIKWQSVQV